MASSPDTRYQYIAVGHVTRDVIEDRADGGQPQPGGGAFYSALQAARLGLRTLIVTKGAPREIESLLEPFSDELDLRILPAEHTTTLSTCGAGAKRRQRLLAWAGPMLEPLTLEAEILHLAPVARETPVRWQGRSDFLGITPQGLLRRWEQGEDVPPVQLDAAPLLGDIPLAPTADIAQGDISLVELDPASLPEYFDAAVISEQEYGSCRALFAAARGRGAYVAVTAGSRPATVHLPDPEGATVTQAVLPQPVMPRDDLGAGDVFAAAFFIALAEGRSPLEAATFGHAAAAVRIAGVGPGAIATRAAITP